MNRNTEITAVGFTGISGIITGVILSPPLLQALMGIELSSRTAFSMTWVIRFRNAGGSLL